MQDNRQNLTIHMLPEEEVKKIAGGDGEVMTIMECTSCGLVTRWPGNLVGQSFPCTRIVDGQLCTGSLIGKSSYWDE